MTTMLAAQRTVRSLLWPLRWLWRTPARRRATLVSGGVVVAGCLGLAVVVGWMMWRLSSGPIPLDTLGESIEQAVAGELGNVSVEIEAAELDSGADGGIVVRLSDVRINDRSGQTVIRAPQAVVGTGLVSAAFGSVEPTSIELIGPHVSVRRSVDGVISLGFGEQPRPAGPEPESPLVALAPDAVEAGQFDAAPQITGAVPSFSPVAMFAATDEAGFLGTVNELLVRQARLTLYDDASQSIWDSFNATLGITRPGSGLEVYVDAPFTTDSGEWQVTFTARQANAEAPLLIDADFENVVPAEIAARMPALVDFAGLMLPVSGRIAATVNADGNVAAVAGDLRLGAGFVRRLPFSSREVSPFLVDEGRIVASYDRDKASLQLERFSVLIGPNRIAFSGAVVPQRDAAGAMVAAQFDLRSDGLRLAADDLARDAAVVERALASGRINFQPLSLEIDTVTVELPQGRVTVGATAELNGSRSVNLRGKIEDLPAASLVQLWPRGLAPGAREWIAANIETGRVREAQIAVSLDQDDLAAADAGTPIDDEAVAIDFTFDGVTAHYLDPLPPIENGSGSATLSGDRFVLSVDRAMAVAPGGEQVAITFGRFEIPSLVGDADGNIDGRINLATSSTTSAALRILDLEPLGFARGVGVDATRVAGDATIVLDLALPLVKDAPLSAVQIQSGATLRDVIVPDAFRSISLEASELEIIATHQRIEVRGDVRLNGVPATAVWDARLDDPEGRLNRLVVNSEVDAADLQQLGIDLTGFVAGTMPVSIEATGRGSALDQYEVAADVTATEITATAIGWSKPEGGEAFLDFTVERLDNGQIRLREIDLDGAGIKVEGAIRLDPDGTLYKADISRLRLGPATDLVFNGVRGDDGVMRGKLQGAEFDATDLVRRALFDEAPREADPTSRPAVIDFTIDRIKGESGIDLTGATGRIQLREGKVSGVRLGGVFESSAALELDYGVGSGATQAVISIDTADAGAFVRFLGVYDRAEGGSMTVRARGPDSRSLLGVVTVRDFEIHEEPLLAKIGETTGLPQRATRNVGFSMLNLEFERRGGSWDVRDALIAGPRVGASMRGNIDMIADTMDVSGTYIPAYGFNAAFGAIPLVGPILSGRSGEGMFGMTYGIAGPMSDLKITINPVSTIAPGLLRRLFEVRQR